MNQPDREPGRHALSVRPDRPAGGPSEEAAAVSPQTVRAAFAGDDEAWRTLVHAYTRRLYALAFSRLRRADLAEEVVQSVFATVASKASAGGYSERGQFEAWLFRIAVNRIRDQIRRSRRSRIHQAPGAIDNAEDQTSHRPDPEALSALREGLELLSPKDREVIELRHHGQMSFKQMAAMLDEPVGTLLARHHRALSKLREILEPTQTDSITPSVQTP